MKKTILSIFIGLLLAASSSFAATNTANNIDIAQQLMILAGFLFISVGMLSSGYALSISLSAYAACESKTRKDAFIPAVMAGSQGIYSFAIAFIMILKMHSNPLEVLLAGILCGLPCLFSAIGQAKTAAYCIKSINNGQMDKGEALLATGLPELYALTGLAAAAILILA